LLQQLPEHKQYVDALAFSPDGKLLATTCSTESLRIWEVATGRKIKELKAVHASILWSPDGKSLATGGGDKILIWDVETGQVTDTLEGHKGGADPVAWLDNGKTLVCAGMDRTLRYWDAHNGRVRRIVPVPALPVASYGGALSHDLRLLAFPFPNALRIWETATGRPHGTLVFLRNDRSTVISADGHFNNPPLERDLVYVVQTDQGQETLSPEEFAQKYGWKNDPECVRLTDR
jgi:WD40 repeat protein